MQKAMKKANCEAMTTATTHVIGLGSRFARPRPRNTEREVMGLGKRGKHNTNSEPTLHVHTSKSKGCLHGVYLVFP